MEIKRCVHVLLTLATVYGTSVSISSICSLPQVKGNCRGIFEMWHYNSTKDTCSLFTYGGCGGNENRFENCTQCMESCSTNENRTEICQLLEKEADEDYYSGWDDNTGGDGYTAPPREAYDEDYDEE
uniref:Thrombin inhibitor n=1 Tax=Amblyomma americanum TaxID=6943 RepID=B5M704_AMBAM